MCMLTITQMRAMNITKDSLVGELFMSGLVNIKSTISSSNRSSSSLSGSVSIFSVLIPTILSVSFSIMPKNQSTISESKNHALNFVSKYCII